MPGIIFLKLSMNCEPIVISNMIKSALQIIGRQDPLEQQQQVAPRSDQLTAFFATFLVICTLDCV
jgi:hypothetical protein